MRKIIVLSLLLVTTLASYSQKSKCNNAIYYLKDYSSTKDTVSLRKAKENIDLASEHPDSKEKAVTQVTKGQIYLTLYELTRRKEEEKLMSISDPNLRTFTAFQNTPTADLDIAYTAFTKGKTLDEKKDFTTELKLLTNIGIYFNNTGRADYNAKKYSDALTAFERAYEISGNADTTVLYFCATSAEMARDYNKAKTYNQKMIDAKQGSGNAYSSLVNATLMLKDTAGAMELLKKGRAAFPNDINLVISETNYFLKTNKSKEALNNLNIALQAKPTDANLHLVRGNIYDNLANPKDASGADLPKPNDYSENIKMAEVDYKKAIELRTNYFDALYNLGVLYFNQGALLNKQASEINIKEQAKYKAATANADEQFNNAMPILEKALETNSKDRNTMIALKQIYTRMQLLDKAKVMNDKLKN